MSQRDVNAITGRLSLRAPQHESLNQLARAIEAAPAMLQHEGDEADVSAVLAALKGLFPTPQDFEREFPSLCFALATGVGKNHLMTALGHAACLRGRAVLFTGAIDIVNALARAQAGGSIKRTLAHYVKSQVLCIDELGYLPMDKFGADGLFQILSHCGERGATLITTNRVYSQWASIFNGGSVLISALLDRLFHHAQTVPIEGRSFRTKDQIEA